MEYEIESEESVSQAVVRAVSAATGSDPTSIRPLADVLDPDALDALFAPRGNGQQRIGGELSFVYNECRVTVQNGEYLSIQFLDAGAGPSPTRPEERTVEYEPADEE